MSETKWDEAWTAIDVLAGVGPAPAQAYRTVRAVLKAGEAAEKRCAELADRLELVAFRRDELRDTSSRAAARVASDMGVLLAEVERERDEALRLFREHNRLWSTRCESAEERAASLTAEVERLRGEIETIAHDAACEAGRMWNPQLGGIAVRLRAAFSAPTERAPHYDSRGRLKHYCTRDACPDIDENTMARIPPPVAPPAAGEGGGTKP